MNGVIHPLQVIPKEKIRFFCFVVANFVLGTVGLTVPVIFGEGKHVFWSLMNEGGGYSVAIAIVSAASLFLLNNAFDRTPTSFVRLRVMAGVISILLLFVLALFTGIQAARPSATVEEYIQSGHGCTQVSMMVLTTIICIWLSCVERLDAHDGFDGLKDDHKELLEKSEHTAKQVEL